MTATAGGMVLRTTGELRSVALPFLGLGPGCCFRAEVRIVVLVELAAGNEPCDAPPFARRDPIYAVAAFGALKTLPSQAALNYSLRGSQFS